MERLPERLQVPALLSMYSSTFTFVHVRCGATVQVVEGQEQPHICVEPPLEDA